MHARFDRPWEIWLVHHSHVDIGYTAPQWRVLPRHADYIATALDTCTATDHLPEESRFRWTCEVSCTVAQFLRRYPDRAQELFRRAREGRVEICGLYVQLTDLFAAELLEEALSLAMELADREEVPITTAMNDDVNGWPWGLPGILAKHGIRYFDTAINETRSLPVRPRPSPFWWIGPQGHTVLLWHGDSYLHGNMLDLKTPGAEERVKRYLARLAQTGYPHHVIETRIGGEFYDNAPPGAWLPETVERWNAAHDVPKLRLITPRTWFEEIEENWPEPIPRLEAGWPDWWADGNGSALYEAALVRRAQADIAAVHALEVCGAEIDSPRVQRATEAAMLFCEHTWGAWDSTDDPDGLNARAQWNYKAGYAYEAATEIGDCLRNSLKGLAAAATATERRGGPDAPAQAAGGGAAEIVVWNPLPWTRTDRVEILVPDRGILGSGVPNVASPQRQDRGPALFLVDQQSGDEIGVRREPAVITSARLAAQRITFVARDVPAQGRRRYRIVVGEPAAPAAASPMPTAAGREAAVAENRHFSVAVDPATGALESVRAGEGGRELVADAPYQLNQCVHETIDHPDGRQRLSTWESVQRNVPWRRTSPLARAVHRELLPYGEAIAATSAWDGGAELSSRVVLYHDIPRVDLENRLRKPWTDEAEAYYQAFPLAADSPTVYLDVPGAVMRPGIDQVPGSATDWHSVQHYFAVSDARWTTLVASPDVPLVQVNGINTGLWQEQLPPHNGTVMSWVLNNYWFTNFPARQGGRLDYRYSIAAWPTDFHTAADDATRFAREIRQPLRAVLLTR